MDSRGVRRSRGQEDEESYFISMADMMVGLLFIFIILLLYFALQFRQTTDALTGANKTRTEILKKLEVRLDQRLGAFGLKVEVNTETGVLSLPNKDNILFATKKYELSDKGREAITIVGQEMAAVLPCYADILPGGPTPMDCSNSRNHKIDAIFVEGHTDGVPLNQIEIPRNNLELSTLRATTTFQQIISTVPGLEFLVNKSGSRPMKILSVSGYGDSRPLPDAVVGTEDGNARNRRIDLRFLMVTPQSDVGAEISQRMAGAK